MNSMSRRSMIIEAKEGNSENNNNNNQQDVEIEREATTSNQILEDIERQDKQQDDVRNYSQSPTRPQRPKTAGVVGSLKYRHMFYSGTWPRVHSELFTGKIDRLAPRDRNMVMFHDVRKQQPETFIFHPEWV